MRTLIVGAGRAGHALARDLLRDEDHGLLPIGFVDDAAQSPKAKAVLPVLGRLSDVARLVTEHDAEAVALAIPGLAPERVREVTRAAVDAGAVVRYLPWFLAASPRVATGSDLRPLDVRALVGGPEPYVVSPEIKEMITGKRVLITGAGSSIGSELYRQVYPFSPSELHLGDHDDDLDDVFRSLRPEVVFHTAGNTHASMLERRPSVAVKTNVLGTDNVVRAANRYGTERFVLISTKANPTSVLGASRRIAELIVQSAAKQDAETVFATVRVGDALDPHSSLLASLADQIRAGGPVTITHPNTAHCFATVEEAVSLALEAARMATGGEIYTLDLGEPVRIAEVVARFTRQYRLPEIPIRFVSSQQSEKPRSDNGIPTKQPRIFTPFANVDPDKLVKLPEQLEKLYRAAHKNRDPRVRQMLVKLAA